jgi:predicted nuclease of predicted toxin-antitoxin system
VKLLFDQNLSHRLVEALKEDYPGSQHVRDVGLKEASDEAVWQYAAQHGLIIVTKDADFHQRSFLLGQPPKVI